MTTTVANPTRTTDTPTPPSVVRVGNASVRTTAPGRVAVISVIDDACLNDVSEKTARDIHTALGQLLGVTA